MHSLEARYESKGRSYVPVVVGQVHHVSCIEGRLGINVVVRGWVVLEVVLGQAQQVLGMHPVDVVLKVHLHVMECLQNEGFVQRLNALHRR